MHGLKFGWYLDVGNDTRRLLLTLAHAHGTLLALIHIVFGLSLRAHPGRLRGQSVASLCLCSASILLPGGFLLGGIVTYAGDAGLGVLLVPLGGLALLVAVLIAARGFPGGGEPPPVRRDRS